MKSIYWEYLLCRSRKAALLEVGLYIGVRWATRRCG